MKSILSRTYTAYGYTAPHAEMQTLLGFNGELPDPLTGLYPLGLGYRSYSANLMRFIAPDSLAPFGAGGLNTYSFTNGDPINYTDPSGHFKVSTLIARRFSPKNQTRSQILMQLDSPAQVNAPYRRNAPPYFSSHPDAFSSPGSPPSYNPGKLPGYSKRLPPGHMRIITPKLDYSGEFVEMPAPPKYEASIPTPKVRNQLPPEQAASYRAELREENARYRRIQSVIRRMERRNLHVPEEYRQNIAEIRQHRDFIRDLLNY